MKVLVVGGGGREHAIVRALKKSEDVHEIWCAPGNGGISYDCNIKNISSTDVKGIVNFAKENKFDFCIVAQDDPLALGMVDELEKVGIRSFGPNKAAARIESSKVFSKNLMKKYGIPTASFEVFDDEKQAKIFIDKNKNYPIVIKADGLALGKGVLICKSKDEALCAIDSLMVDKKFGDSGNKIVIEEFLEGPEVSILTFCDGKTCKEMVSSMDHKRAYDNDEGPNTGGMGVIAPNPFYTKEIANRCKTEIFEPTLKAMINEGCPFKGCLYFGLMITKDGPFVIEYNARFGDPEAQAVLPLLKGDFFKICVACNEGNLDSIDFEFEDKSSAVVIMASNGYPKSYKKGIEIEGLVNGQLENCDLKGVHVAHSGDKIENGVLKTNGGRVLGVVSIDNSLKKALNNAYFAAEKINFDGAFFRHDIGKRALDTIG